MYRKLMHSDNPAIEPGWWEKDIETTFFKCTKWQLEETLDPISCPYHYYCNSTYPGNYHYLIDIIILMFITASFLSTVLMTTIEISRGRRKTQHCQIRRYVLPSGPICLPIMLLIMAKGHRINTLFPIMSFGPAILQLIRVSALAFDSETDSNISYAILEASTISGVLHAALYLDSVTLPYYTGLDALKSSTFSGECMSCICRKEVLVVGGMLILYRGWSMTTSLIAGTLFLRIFCRLTAENTGKTLLLQPMMESLSWILITAECIYFMIISLPENTWSRIASFGSVFVLIFLNILRLLCSWLTALYSGNQGITVQW